MRTFYNVIAEALVRMGTSTTVGFYTDAIMNEWADQGHKWAAGYRKWTVTEGRINTTYVADSTTNEVGLVYPENWRPDSIRLLQVGGKRFRKVNFFQYQAFREDWPSDTKKVFSDFGRLYFINPNADVSGTTTIWGQFSPATWDFTDNTATTLFTDIAEDANEAIVEEIISYAKTKEHKEQEAIVRHEQAIKILLEKLREVQEEQFGYHSGESEGMFRRIDILQGDFFSDLIRRNRWF